MNKLYFSVVSLVAGLVAAGSAFAHVTVKPNEAGMGAFQTFTVGVPVEKDIPTVGMRLVIPEGLNYVTPNVKPGWKIDVKKSGSGEDAAVTEISWTGGSIPAGQRDEFAFSAQVPAQETTVQWKAYQTYQDGSIVSWDQAPSSHEEESENSGPYSETKIVNDLSGSSTGKAATADRKPFVISVAALAVALLALARGFKSA